MAIAKGDRVPIMLWPTGGGGPARVWGHVKNVYSAGEKRILKAPVSNES